MEAQPSAITVDPCCMDLYTKASSVMVSQDINWLIVMVSQDIDWLIVMVSQDIDWLIVMVSQDIDWLIVMVSQDIDLHSVLQKASFLIASLALPY